MKFRNGMTVFSKGLLFISVLGLISCQQRTQQSTLAHIQEIMSEGICEDKVIEKYGTKCLPDNVNRCMIPNLLTAVGTPVPGTERRFDLYADQVPARSFFLGIVQDTPYNVTVHPSVQGTISLQLKRVTIPEIFDTVRNVYGYEFRRSCNAIEIMPATLQTRSYKINYINVNRKGTSEIQVSAGSLNNSNNNNTTTTAGNTSTTSLNSGGTQQQIINSEIDSSSESDFWKELKDTVSTMVGDGEGRKVAVSPMSGLLAVQALPQELRKVEDFLRKAKLTLGRQVLLEAKIMEVELADSYQAGINWEVLSGRLRATQFGQDVVKKILDNSNPENPFPVYADNLAQPIPLLPGKPPGPTYNSGADVGTFGGVFTLAMNYKNLAAFVELLGAQGKVQVLSNPRITTMNNQKAVIKVGIDQYFITNVSTTTTAVGTTATQTPNVTFTPFFSGVALDVTPSIDECDQITLHIHPTISRVQDDRKVFVLNGQTQELPLALSNVRESDTVVRAKSGQMIVIGGLMQDRTRRVIEGIPLLMNLPVLGNLFRHTAERQAKSELVILIRPIIPDDKTWVEVVEDAKQNFDQYGGCNNAF